MRLAGSGQNRVLPACPWAAYQSSASRCAHAEAADFGGGSREEAQKRGEKDGEEIAVLGAGSVLYRHGLDAVFLDPDVQQRLVPAGIPLRMWLIDLAGLHGQEGGDTTMVVAVLPPFVGRHFHVLVFEVAGFVGVQVGPRSLLVERHAVGGLTERGSFGFFLFWVAIATLEDALELGRIAGWAFPSVDLLDARLGSL